MGLEEVTECWPSEGNNSVGNAKFVTRNDDDDAYDDDRAILFT